MPTLLELAERYAAALKKVRPRSLPARLEDVLLALDAAVAERIQELDRERQGLAAKLAAESLAGLPLDLADELLGAMVESLGELNGFVLRGRTELQGVLLELLELEPHGNLSVAADRGVEEIDRLALAVQTQSSAWSELHQAMQQELQNQLAQPNGSRSALLVWN